MWLTPVLAGVAILGPAQVSVVSTPRLEVVREVPLPGPAAGLFVAPDGALILPLAQEDSTLVVPLVGEPMRWLGRVFPLFCESFDRFAALFQGAVATLSYPERVPLARLDVPGLAAVRLAAWSRDSRLLVAVPVGAQSELIEIQLLGDGAVARVGLEAEVTAVAVAPEGTVTVAGLAGGRVAAVVTGEVRARSILVAGGEVRALVFAKDERDIHVGLAVGASGELVTFRLHEGRKAILAERFRVSLDAPVLAIAVDGDDVVVLTTSALVRFDKGGRRRAAARAFAGGTALVALPTRPRSAAPQWSRH